MEEKKYTGIPPIAVVVIVLAVVALVGSRLWEQNVRSSAADPAQARAVDAVVEQLDAEVSQAYDNYEISVTDDPAGIVLYLWQDGLAIEAAKAKDGLEPYKSQWQLTVSNMLTLSKTVQARFDEAGVDVSTTVCIRNDLNEEAILFAAHDGSVILDAVLG